MALTAEQKAALREHIGAEKADLRELVAGLTPEQWQAPSLCDGWTVRDVVAHLVGNNEAGIGAYIAAGLNVDRFNRRQVERRRALSTRELVEALDRNTEVAGASKYVPLVGTLSDLMLHQQDIRRPLGLPRTIPAERLTPVLDSLSRTRTFIPGAQRMSGLRLRATDLDWTAGEGPEVAGPGEALLVALGGRPAALADLEGEGLEILAGRIAA